MNLNHEISLEENVQNIVVQERTTRNTMLYAERKRDEERIDQAMI